MKTEKVKIIFKYSVVVLTAALAVQLGIALINKPGPRLTAVWKNRPQNLGEAKGLARRVVEGTVVNVERADDLVITAPGEPGGVIRIPVEMITLQVTGTVHGQPSQNVQLFHTAGLSVAGKPAPPMNQAPPQPPGGIPPPAQLPQPTEEQAQTVMSDDPPYTKGERYVLFLTEGPQLRVRGQPVITETVVSPSTRFRVAAGDKLMPVVPEAFGGAYKDQPMQKLRGDIQGASPKFPRFELQPGMVVPRGGEEKQPKVGEPETVPPVLEPPEEPPPSK